jgi:periplasmic protein CpxP/Spy
MPQAAARDPKSNGVMLLKTTAQLLCAMSLAVGLAGWAAAQTSPPAPQAVQGGHERWDGPAQAQRWEARRAEHARLLHDALAIRPDQEPAWQAFQSAMTPPRPPNEIAENRSGGEEHLTAPERLDRMAERMHRRDAEFEQRAAAIRRFYAALTPTQQRSFDALAELGRHEPGHGRGRMHEGGGPGDAPE